MSAESILIEVVQILLHLAHGPEHSGSGYDPFRFLVQAEAARNGSSQCQTREEYIYFFHCHNGCYRLMIRPIEYILFIG